MQIPSEFHPDPGPTYLDTATFGLPLDRAVEALGARPLARRQARDPRGLDPDLSRIDQADAVRAALTETASRPPSAARRSAFRPTSTKRG